MEANILEPPVSFWKTPVLVKLLLPDLFAAVCLFACFLFWYDVSATVFPERTSLQGIRLELGEDKANCLPRTPAELRTHHTSSTNPRRSSSTAP